MSRHNDAYAMSLNFQSVIHVLTKGGNEYDSLVLARCQVLLHFVNSEWHAEGVRPGSILAIDKSPVRAMFKSYQGIYWALDDIAYENSASFASAAPFEQRACNFLEDIDLAAKKKWNLALGKPHSNPNITIPPLFYIAPADEGTEAEPTIYRLEETA